MNKDVKILELEKENKRRECLFSIDDTIEVSYAISVSEKGDKVQKIKGRVISRKNKNSIAETFKIVRENKYGRNIVMFNLHNPLVREINLIKTGKSRRAKLYYKTKMLGRIR
jgi:large subunit ribosomal protein L19